MQSSNYHAFLLRVWREDGRAPWRAALENPHTGEKHTFTSPEQFWAYLQAQLDLPEATTPQRAEDDFTEETNRRGGKGAEV